MACDRWHFQVSDALWGFSLTFCLDHSRWFWNLSWRVLSVISPASAQCCANRPSAFWGRLSSSTFLAFNCNHWFQNKCNVQTVGRSESLWSQDIELRVLNKRLQNLNHSFLSVQSDIFLEKTKGLVLHLIWVYEIVYKAEKFITFVHITYIYVTWFPKTEPGICSVIL